MHIPDGFIDAKTAIVSGAAAAVAVGYALRSVKRTLPSSRVPLLGLSAAFIFAAQMINFPVAGGTSGHLLGAVLAAVLLGPGPAILVMTSVLVLQCLMFADGGITALGANILNMAVLAPLVGYAVYRGVMSVFGHSLRARLFGVAFASWCSTVAASVGCACQLAMSGTARLGLVLPAMAGIHMIIGIGEALITTLVVASVARAHPEILDDARLEGRTHGADLVAYGVVLSLVLVVLVAPFASPWPDGLEKVAASLGFESVASARPLVASPMPDYVFPGLNVGWISTAITGLAGTAVAFAMAYFLARALTPRGVRKQGEGTSKN
ncbi:MAG: energy-coupling factor ABC transporter permease [Myxococcota bacterium]|jgi:cobalt/nickel transport system permease protein